MPDKQVLLGVDPGLATMGYAFLELHEGNYRILDFGVITTKPELAFHDRLLLLKQDLAVLVKQYTPNRAYVEELFFGTNAKTALQVAQARGVVISSLSELGLAPVGITPNQVKLGLSGDGNADKQQVQEMLKRQFALNSIPQPDDAADAIAIAYSGSIRERQTLT